MQDARKNFPPVAYVPTTACPTKTGRPGSKTTRTNDGRTALFVYSALDQLHDFYAPDSAWALLTVDDLQAAYDAEPYDLLFLDRRPRPAEVAAG